MLNSELSGSLLFGLCFFDSLVLYQSGGSVLSKLPLSGMIEPRNANVTKALYHCGLQLAL